MKPVIDDRNERVEIGDDALECVHQWCSEPESQNLNTGESLPKRFFRSSSINSIVTIVIPFSRVFFDALLDHGAQEIGDSAQSQRCRVVPLHTGRFLDVKCDLDLVSAFWG